MVRRLRTYLQKNKIIDDYQYGFQQEKSINKLLGDFTSYLNEGLSKNQHSLILFIDFSKAFDTLSHEKILKYLNKVGIRGQCLKWFENYLDNRTYRVKVDNALSREVKVTHGVPQGSKLGPLLYHIHLYKQPY